MRAVDGVSTDVEKAEVVVVIGPSGSGKSTFLRCLNGLEELNGGHVVIDGLDLADKKTDINKVRREGKTLAQLLRRPEVSLDQLAELDAPLAELAGDRQVREQVAIEVKYEGYLRRQRGQVERFRRSEDSRIPSWVSYEAIPQLRTEAKEKLAALQEQSSQWEAIDDQIRQAERVRDDMASDLTVLQLQFRVVKDEELNNALLKLANQITAVEEAQEVVAEGTSEERTVRSFSAVKSSSDHPTVDFPWSV